MTDRNHGDLAEWYDTLSKGYDELYGKEQSQKIQRVLNIVAGQEFNLTVDVGCGTGALLSKITKVSLQVVGVDLSREMLKLARAKVASQNLNLIQAACEALPVRSALADCAFSVSTIELGCSAPRMISELKRIVRIGGTIVLSILRGDGGTASAENFGLPNHTSHEAISPREELYQASL